MKLLPRLLALLFVTTLFPPTLWATPKLHVLIDPGHGGIDTGAVRGHIKESHIALAVGRHLADLLRADSLFQVTMTRDSDQALTLAERTQIAKRVHADVFLSIHANASKDPRAHGVEFWFQNQLPADEESLFLASRENQTSDGIAQPNKDEGISRQGDLARIIDDLQRNYRIAASSELSQILLANWHVEARRKNKNSIHQAPFFVVSEPTIPAVLVELGFVSHETEGPQVADPVQQKRMAQNLYNGLVRFRSVLEKDREKN